ncbi:MAG: hypothetical protein EA353_06040 [Puniceicoccaceae bacterium]|nr:MAG: hypothetical protein EA353_06040 [Puniceicoccaceae bacterium]
MGGQHDSAFVANILYMKINFTENWCEATPDAASLSLLAEEGGRLRLLAPDLSPRHDYGAVGPVDCPIAYDPVRRLGFRYVCAGGAQRGDYSQLRAFSVDRQHSFAVNELPLNRWVLWFLHWLESTGSRPGQLLGLVAVDQPSEDQVLIEHHLFTHKAGEERLRLNRLSRDAYKPLAFSRRRREMVFAGAEGIYLLGLRGERKLTLPAESPAGGQGAAFCPDGGAQVVVGGDGLHLWDLELNSCRRLTRNGRHPVWAPDGKSIWYRGSSADLHRYDVERDEVECLVGLPNQRNPEFWHAGPVCLSRDGRFLATALTEKVLRGVSQRGNATGERERVFAHNHSLLVMDLKRQVYWTRPGFAKHLCWVE